MARLSTDDGTSNRYCLSLLGLSRSPPATSFFTSCWIVFGCGAWRHVPWRGFPWESISLLQRCFLELDFPAAGVEHPNVLSRYPPDFLDRERRRQAYPTAGSGRRVLCDETGTPCDRLSVYLFWTDMEGIVSSRDRKGIHSDCCRRVP